MLQKKKTTKNIFKRTQEAARTNKHSLQRIPLTKERNQKSHLMIEGCMLSKKKDSELKDTGSQGFFLTDTGMMRGHRKKVSSATEISFFREAGFN